ncbi:copper transporter [Corynebacterium mayonis]|uniref:copper transporter n=1 Tax=Corynebacterium mayonis TaxID=3062461 RepID=UPI00314043D2
MGRKDGGRRTAARRGGRTIAALAGVTWGLAAGIVAGALVVAPALSAVGDTTTDSAAASTQQALARAEAAEGELAAANELLGQKGAEFVEGVLRDNAVLVIYAPGSQPETYSRVAELLDAAGADPAGVVTLSEKFTSQQGADELATIISHTLPAGAQLSTHNQSAATHAGESFAQGLFTGAEGQARASQNDRDFLVSSLAEAGYVSTQGDVIAADAVVILTAEAEETSARFADGAVGDFAVALSARDVPVVVALQGSKNNSGVEIALSERGEHGVETVEIAATEAGAINVIRALRAVLAQE